MELRLVQLATRYIGVWLMAVAGWLVGSNGEEVDVGLVEEYATAIATAAVALVFLFGDLMIRRLRKRLNL
jgi:hypothetical protein